MSKSVLVLLSGGLDSGVLLSWVKSKGLVPVALDFDFPGRLKAEQHAAQEVARSAGIEQVVQVPLPFVETPREELSNYIPRRNLMFYGIAASLAETWSVGEIYGGHIRSDAESFSDARADYFDSLNSLIAGGAHNGKNHACKIVTPFITMEKPDIIRMGDQLRVPFKLMWSCLRDGSQHCWECSSCKERRSGFEGAGVRDPLDPRG